jgi:hypothetical protein
MHLDADSAWALEGWIPTGDSAHRELVDAISEWERLRDEAA